MTGTVPIPFQWQSIWSSDHIQITALFVDISLQNRKYHLQQTFQKYIHKHI